MSPLRKRLLIGLGLVVAVVGFSFLIYWQFFLVAVPAGTNANSSVFGRVLPNIANSLLRNRNSNRPIFNGNSAVVNQQLPKPVSVANGGLTIAPTLVDGGTLQPSLGSSGRDIQYYDPLKGQFWRLSPDGRSKSLLTDQTFAGATDVHWSPAGEKAVITFPDDSKIVYDFNKKQQYSLPKEATSPDFSPDGNSLIYKFVGAKDIDRWLATSNADGTGATLVENISDKDLQVSPSWSPNQQVVATFVKGAGGEQQEVIFLGLNGENFPSATVTGRGFQSKWATDGNSILFTTYTSDGLNNPTLSIMDGRPDSLGQRQVDLGVQTFVDKCGFGPSTTAVYCAVPRFLPAGSGLVRELAGSSSDDFYRIDLATGARQLIAQPTDADGLAEYNATDVTVSTDGSMLYFRDSRNNSLHSLRLK